MYERSKTSRGLEQPATTGVDGKQPGAFPDALDAWAVFGLRRPANGRDEAHDEDLHGTGAVAAYQICGASTALYSPRLRIQISPETFPRAYSSCLPSRENCGSSRKRSDSGKSVILTGSAGFQFCPGPGTRHKFL